MVTLNIKTNTHNILCKSSSSASVNQYASIGINVSQIHRRTLHFWVRKTKLSVNIIDTFKEIREISSSGLYRDVVAEKARR